jgi:hypothetical protein
MAPGFTSCPGRDPRRCWRQCCFDPQVPVGSAPATNDHAVQVRLSNSNSTRAPLPSIVIYHLFSVPPSECTEAETAGAKFNGNAHLHSRATTMRSLRFGHHFGQPTDVCRANPPGTSKKHQHHEHSTSNVGGWQRNAQRTLSTASARTSRDCKLQCRFNDSTIAGSNLNMLRWFPDAWCGDGQNNPENTVRHQDQSPNPNGSLRRLLLPLLYSLVGGHLDGAGHGRAHASVLHSEQTGDGASTGG